MRFAIVESGGKQYRAVEGRTIEVDRLPVDAGNKFDLERVLLMADDDQVMVGTPTLSGIEVKVTVVDHLKGPKIDRFKYRPKKRIRVRGGHRQQYTRLMVDFIGKPGEERTLAPSASAGEVEEPAISALEAQPDVEAVVEVKAEVEEAPKVKKQAKAEKAPAKKPSAKSTEKKPSTKKSSKK